MLLIKGGHVTDPEEGIDDRLDILTDGCTIKRTDKNIASESCPEAQLIDATGCIVAPGFVDVHSHFREPGQTEKETVHTGAAAAAAGGYTSVVLMANTDPCVDDTAALNYVFERMRTVDIHLYQDAALTAERNGKRLTDMEKLAEAGAAGFTDDGTADLDADIVRQGMITAQRLGLPISFHEEDPSYISESGINAGNVARRLGLKGASREAETVLAKRDLDMALETGASIDIQHVSAAETVGLIREAKKRDEKGIIHAEATPHHFSLTEDAILEFGTNAKVNPPLRTEADRMAIIGGLQDGTLDIIATDHAPHTELQKKNAFISAPSGMIGLETALGLAVTKLVRPGYISIHELIGLMSRNPAKMYGLKAGSLAAGMPADVVIFDPEEEWTVGNFFSKSSNSPFTGSRLYGRVKYTIASGKIVFRQNS